MPTPQRSPLATRHRRGRPGCFGCDRTNRAGLRLRFRAATRGGAHVVARTRLPAHLQGPPGCAHGGIVAALLDEAMAKATAALGVLALTRTLAIDFRRPVPLRAPLRVEGRFVRRRGRVLHLAASLRAFDGTELATATARFVEPPAALAARIDAADRAQSRRG